MNGRVRPGGDDRSVSWRILKYSCALVSFLCVMWAASYASTSFRADQSTGRVYPVYDHGNVTYLTHREYLTRRISFVAAGVAAVAFFVIDWKVDTLG